jgi:hypothetical protein
MSPAGRCSKIAKVEIFLKMSFKSYLTFLRVFITARKHGLSLGAKSIILAASWTLTQAKERMHSEDGKRT